MSWHFTGISATCEGVAKKGCPHKATLLLPNTDGMVGSVLFNVAARDGWLLPPGGGKVLCVQCVDVAEQKYKVKLKKEIREKEKKLEQEGAVSI